MGISQAIWPSPAAYLAAQPCLNPVCFFSPRILQNTVSRFQAGFPGLVTFALKANPDEPVLENLLAAGLTAFDVASPAEIDLVRRHAPNAQLHYNNPVRALNEIRYADAMGVCSYSVDRLRELEKITDNVRNRDVEISVRIKLPVTGAQYDFGSKFGATPAVAAGLLQKVQALGFRPSLTFHAGTQCRDANAWRSYIKAASLVARQANVRLYRLNVGGGYPSHRSSQAPDLEKIFKTIQKSVTLEFPENPPSLLCEPGRALVAESMAVAARVKSTDGQSEVFLNDGIYGGFGETPSIEISDRYSALTAQGIPVGGPASAKTVFGPTCDSLDTFPEKLLLPDALAEDDYLIFQGMGAYSSALRTGFNGYGTSETVTVLSLAS